MDNLIIDLKADHVRLAEKINEAKNTGLSSGAGRQLLISIKNDLLDHLKKEDEKLYPKLHELGARDVEIKRVLDSFAKDMEAITQFALSFFDKYTRESSSIDFYKDIGRLLAALSDRIRKEEGVLYAIYERNI